MRWRACMAGGRPDPGTPGGGLGCRITRQAPTIAATRATASDAEALAAFNQTIEHQAGQR
jgi:hypothetical protein